MTKTHAPKRPQVLALAQTSARPLALCATLAFCAAPLCAQAQQDQPQSVGRLSIAVDKPGITISPLFYGMMTEEINHAYDGGLYAELIQNRALKDDAKGPAHWSLVEGVGAGSIALDTSQPVSGTELSHSLRLDATRPGAGVANEGFWGIPVRANTTYRASFWAKASADFAGPLTVSIESNDGERTFARGAIAGVSGAWKKYSLPLSIGAAQPSTANRFVIRAAGTGSLWLSQVSLMPPTFKARPNGLRPDLMRLMSALKPSYLRFPGGNYLEGNTIAERFDWKKTLGPIESRPGHQAPWGYRSSDGMGLMEFLGWCEDLKMEPLLAVFAGYALQGEHIAAGPGLQPFIQDALDEIEYVTGPVTSTWGARRARDGHPAPFPLRYVEIGNEDWFDRSGSYDGRYAAFHDAIKARYPKLQLIATMPVTSRTPDLLDDHYYRSATEMARDSDHYDSHDRRGPKIFVGEWASTEGNPTPTLQAALGDAAWLTGLERNSDHVIMQCYAPLLVNVNRGAQQWGTNLIGYDALSSYGSPSYWAQVMFGQNTGDRVLPSILTAPPSIVSTSGRGKVGVGTWNTQAEFKDITVTAPDGRELYRSDFGAGLGGFAPGEGTWSITDGALRQSNLGTTAAPLGRATVGDAGWGDYTLRLKARKISGAEGFFILARVQDEKSFTWWNVGGWGNTRSRIEWSQHGSRTEIGTRSNATIEAGRWYDVRVEVKGNSIRCFLDNALVNEATYEAPATLFGAASRDTRRGEVILKMVNMAAQPQTLQVELNGARSVGAVAPAQVLAGDPGAVNSIAEPMKVAPRGLTIRGVARTFRHQFPAHSVTVMRLRAR